MLLNPFPTTQIEPSLRHFSQPIIRRRNELLVGSSCQIGHSLLGRVVVIPLLGSIQSLPQQKLVQAVRFFLKLIHSLIPNQCGATHQYIPLKYSPLLMITGRI